MEGCREVTCKLVVRRLSEFRYMSGWRAGYGDVSIRRKCSLVQNMCLPPPCFVSAVRFSCAVQVRWRHPVARTRRDHHARRGTPQASARFLKKLPEGSWH